MSILSSRAARDASLNPAWLTDEYVHAVRGLAAIAEQRGQTLAQLAVAWTLRDRRVTSSLIGASSVQQLHDSLGAVRNLDFSDEEIAQIDGRRRERGEPVKNHRCQRVGRPHRLRSYRRPPRRRSW